MFEKLLSLVPYNPGLVPQLAFYSKRMREEASIRRTGAIFMFLAFVIQFFAVLAPPQPSVAGSSNDIINGGFSSREQAHDQCQADNQGFQRLLHYYGISCSEVKTATVHNISTTGNNYYSIGRNKSPVQDTPVSVPGTGTLYWRDMSAAWGNYSFKALQVQNQDGKTYYIMYDCANLATVGVPPASQLRTPPPAPKPPAPAATPPPAPTAPAPTPSSPAPPPVTPASTPPPAPCPYNSSLPANSPLCYEACPYNPLLPVGDSKCRPCEQSVSTTDTVACISVRKQASNITAGVADAHNTTAKASDVISYTLFAENKGKATVKDFKFTENLNDVLDYADVIDLHGGTLSNDKNVTWPATDITAGATATVKVTVKVKDPIPQTPISASDPYHFDLVMTNVYGNTVNIKLPGTPVKTVEVAAATLPKTGPGTTLVIAAGAMIIAGYFYGRASLLARESEIAIKETVTA